MSLTASLSSAISGLTVSARLAETLSNNVSNALTEGYARREVQVTSRGLDGGTAGVQVAGLVRDVDPVLLSDRRLSQASASGLDREAEFLRSFETALGTPGDARSLTGRVAALEKALIEAAARPDSEPWLSSVMTSARGLTEQIGSASRTVQSERGAADRRIAEATRDLNDGLAAVADANQRIRTLMTAGRDATALMDERQKLIDTLAGVVPLREISRPDGQIALFTTGGAQLLDGRPAVLAFVPVGQVTPDMELGAGLSGITLNGTPIRVEGSGGLLDGGSLAADFVIRDRLGVDAQSRLDAMAGDLVQRMEGVDPSQLPGSPGLFTDEGQSFDASRTRGLAQRLIVNALADPAQGGSLWRLRSGLGAPQPGPPGDTRLLTTLHDALTQERSTAGGGFMAAERSFAVLAADLLSGASGARLTAEAESSFATARSSALTTLELERGVDTDREMQELLLVEQAFGANARVVQTVDELIQMLLRMGG